MYYVSQHLCLMQITNDEKNVLIKFCRGKKEDVATDAESYVLLSMHPTNLSPKNVLTC